MRLSIPFGVNGSQAKLKGRIAERIGGFFAIRKTPTDSVVGIEISFNSLSTQRMTVLFVLQEMRWRREMKPIKQKADEVENNEAVKFANVSGYALNSKERIVL